MLEVWAIGLLTFAVSVSCVVEPASNYSRRCSISERRSKARMGYSTLYRDNHIYKDTSVDPLRHQSNNVGIQSSHPRSVHPHLRQHHMDPTDILLLDLLHGALL